MYHSILTSKCVEYHSILCIISGCLCTIRTMVVTYSAEYFDVNILYIFAESAVIRFSGFTSLILSILRYACEIFFIL